MGCPAAAERSGQHAATEDDVTRNFDRSDPSDPRRIEQAAGGSPVALGEIYARYSADLYGLALRLTGSPADAWDVVHDVFAGLPEALHTAYEERGHFRAWLLKVTTRTALMKLRRRQQRRELSLDHLWPGGRGGGLDHPVDRVALEGAVEMLSPALRAVFVLKTEGLSHTEIGEALGISTGASRVRLCRAHEQLRRLL